MSTLTRNARRMTKILVADDLGEEGMALLRAVGDVTVKTGMDEATLRDTLPGFETLVVRSATAVERSALTTPGCTTAE